MAKLTVCCAVIGYFFGVFYLSYFQPDPYKTLKISAFNITLSKPIHMKAKELNIDGGIITFLHNSLLAFLFIAPLFLAGSGRMKWLFHSGGDQPPDGSWNDRIGRLIIRMMGLPKDARKKTIDLALLLNSVNWLSTGIIAFFLGFTCATLETICQTPLILIAGLAPHGVIELPALFVAAGLPPALFSVLKSEIEKDGGADTFSISRRIAGSKTVIAATLAVFIGFAAAGQIEDKITPKVIKYFNLSVKAKTK